MIVVGTIFFISTHFISQEINNVFVSESAEGVQALDVARYMLVAKKLGITVSPPSEKINELAEQTPAPETPAPPTTILDKKAITITVLNSTNKKGIAGTLAATLKDAGFSTPSTGNEKNPYAKTTILVKESKYDYAPLLLEAVLPSYPNAFATTTPETSPFDATIIIGAE